MTFSMRKMWHWAAVLAAVLLWGSMAAANPVQREHTAAELISETATVAPGDSFWTAVRLTPLPGWHTYWRHPGDSGMPTSLEWSLPPGVIAGPVVWPAPERIEYQSLVNYGYHGPVTLLTRIDVAKDAKFDGDLVLKVRVDWLVCEEICVPEDADLVLALPQGPPARNARGAALIAEALAQVPEAASWPAHFMVSDGDFRLTVDAPDLDPANVTAAYFFPHQDGVITHAAPQRLTWTEGGDPTLTTKRGYQTDLGPVNGTLRLTGPDGALAFYDITANPVEAGAGGPPPVMGTLSLWQALLFAFVGGLILNLMPCVFPVLSLKALAIATKANHDQREIRLDTVAFTLGVLLSFSVLAAVLLAARQAGELVGWGFQLQSPLVVLLLAYVLFAIGLNLSGLFVVGGRVAGLGQTLAARPGRSGAFFTGVLATVVAAPCTAPFMAGAIGFALTQSAAVAVVIFLALGLGLAAPFIVFSLWPGLHRRLPKPGPWMETFKQILAFPMYAAAAWLVWVLSLQTGALGVAVALAGGVLLAFAAWAYGWAQQRQDRWGAGMKILAALAVVAALALVTMPRTLDQPPSAIATSADDGLKAMPWSAETVVALRAEGRPVFVNFTAAWCITCLANERMALTSSRVAAELKRHNVAYLKADWTNRDAAITTALQNFGRSGVPLYVLYPADTTKPPEILPQLLTEAIVLKSINRIVE